MITSFFTYSQKINYDIFILFENDTYQKIYGTHNDTLVYQVFDLKVQLNSSSTEYMINDNNLLESKIILKGSKGTNNIRLSYKNANNSNLPFILNKDIPMNLIKYPSGFLGCKLENINKILNKSSNIYIIESDSNYGYYLVKKVELN